MLFAFTKHPAPLPSLGMTGKLNLQRFREWIQASRSRPTLTIGPGSQVTMSGGVLPKNVFWQVGGPATLGSNATLAGNILAQNPPPLGPAPRLIAGR